MFLIICLEVGIEASFRFYRRNIRRVRKCSFELFSHIDQSGLSDYCVRN